MNIMYSHNFYDFYDKYDKYDYCLFCVLNFKSHLHNIDYGMLYLVAIVSVFVINNIILT